MNETPTPSIPATAARVSTATLIWGFMKVGLSGFGGVLPFARRMLVDERRWLTEPEFNEVLSLAQFLPGPNIVNVAVIVGRRFQGPIGAIGASLGLMTMPMVIVLVLATVFARFAEQEAVRGACNGVSAAASGLVLTVGMKMLPPIRGTRWQVGIAAIVVVAIGVARLPMLWVLAAVAPIALGIAWWRRG